MGFFRYLDAWFIAYALASILCSSCLGQSPSLAAVIRDDRTLWYDADSLPGCYQSDNGLLAVGYNPATFPGQEDATGSANNESPWRHTGGLDACGPSVTARRLLWIPAGEKIKLRTETRVITTTKRRGIRFNRVRGWYPIGTVSAELLLDGRRVFEVRERRKTRGGWVTDQIEFGRKPFGYKAVDNCTDCHEDIGKHSFMLDADRDWYGVVRGLEPDGPIHFHPWDTTGLGGAGIPLRIREDVRHFVEWE